MLRAVDRCRQQRVGMHSVIVADAAPDEVYTAKRRTIPSHRVKNISAMLGLSRDRGMPIGLGAT
jgi:hypothetical protein